MAYINQNKNLKVALVSPDGIVNTYYDKEFRDESGTPYDMHYEVIYEALKRDYANNTKLIKKANKCRGQNLALIHLALDYGIVVIYDTTNYHNYSPYKDHTGTMMLPVNPEKLPRTQQIALLKLLKELPMNETGKEYSAEDHLPYVTYSLFQVAYRDKKKRPVQFGDINDLVCKLTGENLELINESKLK